MSSNQDRAAWIRGGQGVCLEMPLMVKHPYRLVLLGAPGVGKGTQADLLSQRLGACHLSTGDIFRAAKAAPASARSQAMNQAVEIMRCGGLVSDELTLDIVRERTRCLRCGGGVLLDGFPRTVVQAEALENLFNSERVSLTGAIDYELPIETIVARLSGRRTCPDCRATFHLETRPPKEAGHCDHCRAALIQREDDRPESVRVRMAAYHKSTEPLIEFYRRRGLLITVSADGAPEAILERTLAALQSVSLTPA